MWYWCCFSLTSSNGFLRYIYIYIYIYIYKADNKNVNFSAHLCLRNISEKFAAIESREVSFKGLSTEVYFKGNFSFEYNAIHKSDILNIHKYKILMIQWCMK